MESYYGIFGMPEVIGILPCYTMNVRNSMNLAMLYSEPSESYDAVLRILEVGVLPCYVRNLSQSLGFILRNVIHHMSPRNPGMLCDFG